MMDVYPYHGDFNATDGGTSLATISVPPGVVLESVHMELNTAGYAHGNIFLRIPVSNVNTKVQLTSGPISLIAGGVGIDELTWDGAITIPQGYSARLIFDCRNHSGGTVKVLYDATWRYKK